jgi:hypothetical protein
MAPWLARFSVVAATLGLLAACAGPGSDEPPNPYLTAAIGENGPGTAPGPGIFPLVPATHAHVQLKCPLVSAIHYDRSTIPLSAVDAVYICTTRGWDDSYDGTPQLEEFVDRVATDDIPALLDAYSEPDAFHGLGVACAAMLQDPLIIWLHYGDEQITPVYAPQDECSFPQASAAKVYAALDLHRVLVAREKTKP